MDSEEQQRIDALELKMETLAFALGEVIGNSSSATSVRSAVYEQVATTRHVSELPDAEAWLLTWLGKKPAQY